MAGKNHVIKVILGFAALFLFYHTSETVGSNPLWILLPFVLFVPIAHVIGKRLGSGGLAGFGMPRHAGGGRNLWLGFLSGAVFYTAAMVYAFWRGEISFAGLFHWQQVLPLVVGMAFLTFWSSVSEDLLTRGFVFHFLQRRIAKKHLIWLSSVLYTLNHIWRIEHSYTQWIMLFLMGLTFAIPFAKTGSLWFTIGCHWGWNTVAIFKDHIGEQTTFQVLDKTSDWLYIVTMAIFLLFVMIRQDRVAKAWQMSYNTNNFIQGIDEKE